MQFPLEKNCVKLGTVLIETVFSRDSLYWLVVLYICVGFWLLAHLTCDLSQAEKK